MAIDVARYIGEPTTKKTAIEEKRAMLQLDGALFGRIDRYGDKFSAVVYFEDRVGLGPRMHYWTVDDDNMRRRLAQRSAVEKRAATVAKNKTLARR